jgi:dienelactone hydrolase
MKWALLLLLLASSAHAQKPPSLCDILRSEAGKRFCQNAYSVAPLTLPTTAHEGASAAIPLEMAIYKPPGPFPALIMLHTCADMSTNTQIPFWVQNAVQRGYVAFVLDSFAQRGVTGERGCSASGLPGAVRVRDTFEAQTHLTHFPFIDPTRIAAIGWSQGARIAYLLASENIGAIFRQHLAATIALYGMCHSPTLNLDYLRPDAQTPRLALLGADDIDGDPHTCVPRLEALQKSGAPATWHVYPNTGHVWDQPDRLSRKLMPFEDPPGSHVLFYYRRDITEDSRNRVFAFLANTLK